MAEIALAVPGLIDVIARSGLSIIQILDAYEGHDTLLAEYQRFAEDIDQRGMSFFFLETLKRAYQDHSLPTSIKVLLKNRITQFNKKLSQAVHELKDVAKWSNGRINYILRDREALERRMQDLKAEKDCLHEFGILICTFSIGLHSSFLTPENFVLIHETSVQHPGEYLPTSDIIVARGNVNLGLGKSTGMFIIEGKSDGKKNIQALCQTLRDRSFPDGIPECLGYREPPYAEGFSCFEFVFRVPYEDSWMSLAHAISSRSVPDMRIRLQLCQKLAQAVCDTHGLEFVHKNIRPRSILLTGSDCSSFGILPKVFLMKWTSARLFQTVSAHLGEHLWQQALYQHPDRQSRNAMDGFQPYHDIYSLGVCMLEVLLWKPFTIGSPPPKLTMYSHSSSDETLNQHITSPAWLLRLFEDSIMELGITKSELYSNTCAIMAEHKVSQQVWIQLAQTELLTLDHRAADILIKCLKLQFGDATRILSELKDIVK